MKAETGMSELQKSNPGPDYVHLLAEVKDCIRSAQYTALKAINTELVGKRSINHRVPPGSELVQI